MIQEHGIDELDFFTCSGIGAWERYFCGRADICERITALRLLCGLHEFRLFSRNVLREALIHRSGFPLWLLRACDAFTGREDMSLVKLFPEPLPEFRRSPSELLRLIEEIQGKNPVVALKAALDFMINSPSQQRLMLLKILRGERRSWFDILPFFCKGLGLSLAEVVRVLQGSGRLDFFEEKVRKLVGTEGNSGDDLFPVMWLRPLEREQGNAEGFVQLRLPYADVVCLSVGQDLLIQDRRGRVYAETLYSDEERVVRHFLEAVMMEPSGRMVKLSSYQRLGKKARGGIVFLCTDYLGLSGGSGYSESYASRLKRLDELLRGELSGFPFSIISDSQFFYDVTPAAGAWLKSRHVLFGDRVFERSEQLEGELHLMYVKEDRFSGRVFVFGEEVLGKWKGVVSNPDGYRELETAMLGYVGKNLLRKSGPVRIVRPGFVVRVRYSLGGGWKVEGWKVESWKVQGHSDKA